MPQSTISLSLGGAHLAERLYRQRPLKPDLVNTGGGTSGFKRITIINIINTDTAR